MSQLVRFEPCAYTTCNFTEIWMSSIKVLLCAKKELDKKYVEKQYPQHLQGGPTWLCARGWRPKTVTADEPVSVRGQMSMKGILEV